MATQCSKCDSKAVYLRRYTSEALCDSCLAETTLQRVRRTINKHKMFRENDRIAVAISGGKDSSVLLHILHRIEKKYPDSEIIPITIDEGIMGYRDRALEAAKKLTRSLDLTLEVRSFRELFGHSLDDIVKMRKSDKPIGACSFCGVLRRRAINSTASELEADVVATGHNMDDEAQTLLINMLRGDSRRIVRTSRPREKALRGFVPRVKPIMEITERDVVAYSHSQALEYHDVPCPYSVEAYRNDVKDFLNDMEHRRPGTLLAILRSGEEIGKAFEQTPVATELRECEQCGSVTPDRICKVCSMLSDISGN
ncbi:MAG: TIGR00269 family protein [Candidatus Thorarchaeota archaeon]|nr:MAG: TIGR00269 family protein [Candidatus Thorarchaeota archaeon]